MQRFMETSQFFVQRLALAVLILAAIYATIMTVLAAIGVLPWFDISATRGGVDWPDFGMYLQIFLTVMLLSVLFFIPSGMRVLRLETSHRDFHIGMQDVAQAYVLAHTADREGAFQLSSEFDAVRERLRFLRTHPDLSELEPQLLEVAAQMSQISAELAKTYSDENMDRARMFLRQRQEEVDKFNERLGVAQAMTQELKGWVAQVEMDEQIALSKLRRLRDDLAEYLPEVLNMPDDGDVIEFHPREEERL